MALIGSLTSGVSALDSFQKGIEVIGNNIANVNTTGYKNQTAEYADGFSTMLEAATPPSSAGGSNTNAMQIGTGVKVDSIASNFGQGVLTSTNNNTDMAIAGNGFFTVVDGSTGNSYVTRAGNFNVDSAGGLVTSSGYSVQGLTGGATSYTATDVNGTLTFTKSVSAPTAPSTIGSISMTPTITIVDSTGGAFTSSQIQAKAPSIQGFTLDSSGNVVISLSNGDTFNSGQVLLQNFNDPNALTKMGNNLYSNQSLAGPMSGSTSLSAASNAPGTNGLGNIQVGALEQSNVDLSSQFADLITVERSFQAGSRLVTVSDSILEEVVSLKRS